TFGEIMLRLSPPGFERFLQSPVLSAVFGGGEANVAASLAHFGLTSRYVTCLPIHAIGEAALRALRAEGIDTSFVLRGGERVSVDLNYRKKLWSEAQAQSAMRPLMRDVDVVVANEEDLQAVLGIPVVGADVTGGFFDVAGYRDAAERVAREFGPSIVAITLR